MPLLKNQRSAPILEGIADYHKRKMAPFTVPGPGEEPWRT
jgi:hypothetical protein